jgi:hypothetical protein
MNDHNVNGPSKQEALPPPEGRIGALAVKAYARFAARTRVAAVFRDEAAAILRLARGIPEAVGRKPTRITRGIGMEPASREWSVFMTLEHLVIVNRGITAVVHALCADNNPGVELRIQDIQPHADAGPEHIEALAQSADRYLEIVERFGSLTCPQRYPHPWFGPLTAGEWHVLAAWHNRIHRRQIQRILRARGLPVR